MALLVTDPDLETRLLTERRNADSDHFDEVWEGLYIMAPMPNNEHQNLQGNFVAAIKDALGWDSPADVCAGVNVSDLDEDWTHNFRCPDVVVFLPGNPAVNRGTHWQGGPDFLVEIVSKGDRSEEKLAFYAGVGVREALIIYRDPWKLELYTSTGSPAVMRRVGTVTLEANAELRSIVLPISFQITAASPRPKVQLKLTSSVAAGGRTSWLV